MKKCKKKTRNLKTLDVYISETVFFKTILSSLKICNRGRAILLTLVSWEFQRMMALSQKTLFSNPPNCTILETYFSTYLKQNYVQTHTNKITKRFTDKQVTVLQIVNELMKKRTSANISCKNLGGFSEYTLEKLQNNTVDNLL